MTDEQLDELHRIKRMLSRQQGKRITIEELLQEGVRLVLRYYQSIDDSDQAPEVQP
jgi:hypothetical protein